MKTLPWLALLAIGCGSSGELGKAQFYVGEGWGNNSKIASGSSFSVSATQGIWRTRLQMKGCSEDMIQLQGEIATATGEGHCVFEAYDETDTLVDRFHIHIIEPTEIHLYDENDPNEYWTGVLPDQFALIERTNSELSLHVKGEDNQILQHSSLLSIENEDSYISSIYMSDKSISIHGHQEGKSSFSIYGPNSIQKEYSVIVIDEEDIQSIMFRLSQPQDYIPGLGDSQQYHYSGSWVYMHVDIRSWDQSPVLLPEDSVQIVGQEDYLQTGPFGFWVQKNSEESIEIELKIGSRTAFAYID